MSKRIEQTASELLDINALTARVDAVLNEPLYWFPVRHHSPTIARHLAQAIRQRKPKIVFIEGPFEGQGMIEFLIDAKTKPPVAIYSSFRDDSLATDEQPAPRLSVWYPLTAYSPEYVAMMTAREVGAKSMFIDLPHYAIERRPIAPGEEPKGSLHRRHLDDIVPASTFYQLLAKSAGYTLVNADVTILAERPKLKPFKPLMIENLRQILGGQINIKAGTNEKCDAIGRGEAIAAHAVVLLAK